MSNLILFTILIVISVNDLVAERETDQKVYLLKQYMPANAFKRGEEYCSHSQKLFS